MWNLLGNLRIHSAQQLTCVIVNNTHMKTHSIIRNKDRLNFCGLGPTHTPMGIRFPNIVVSHHSISIRWITPANTTPGYQRPQCMAAKATIFVSRFGPEFNSLWLRIRKTITFLEDSTHACASHTKHVWAVTHQQPNGWVDI